MRFGQDYNPGAADLLRYLISQALHPRVPGALALEAQQHGDLGQPQHPALRRDGLPPCHRKMERAGIVGDKPYGVGDKLAGENHAREAALAV